MPSEMSNNYHFFLSTTSGRRVASAWNSNFHFTPSIQLRRGINEGKIGGLWFVLTGLCGRVGYLGGGGRENGNLVRIEAQRKKKL